MTNTHQGTAFRYHNELGLVMVGGGNGGTKVTATLDGQTFQVLDAVQGWAKEWSLGLQFFSSCMLHHRLSVCL